MTRPRQLRAYVGLLAGLALPLFVLVALATPWGRQPLDPAALLVLAAVLVVGELRPIMVSHGDDRVDLVTISCCFSLALVLQGPLAVALALQAVALLVDDVRCRRPLLKVVFNHANFVLSLSLARLVHATLSGQPFLVGERALTADDVVPALVAGAVFFVVNQGLTTTVICLATGERLVPSLVRDLTHHASSVLVLLALAPVVVHAVALSPLLVLLLVGPVIAVHTSSRLAIDREHQALHDTLTGLPNRALFHERAGRAVRQHGEGVLAVMLTDLDHFKQVNDTLGHQVGDRLLVQVAERLRAAVRDQDLVARLGGDEFAVLCPELPDAEAAGELASRVVAAMETAFTIDGVRLDVRASVGVAVGPADAEHEHALLQRADVALYAAKAQRGTWALSVPPEEGAAEQGLALLGQLETGLDRDELVVHFQPLCDARTGGLLAVEALVRWQHPELGLVPPGGFLAVAEGTGLIARLTQVVLDRTLSQLVGWDRQGLRLDASVNLSGRQLTDLALPGLVEAALQRHGVAPRRLVVELTESQLAADPGRVASVLGGLRAVGVGLAVDDFGTGHSSLVQLRALAVDVLKIDRSFVTDMCRVADDALIVRSTIDLAHGLGLRVVAEGVEDEPTSVALAALGCDVVQGFHLSRPLSGDQLLAWARERQALPTEDRAPA